MEIEDDALKLMLEFSAGSPTMMQNIGDEIYWINNSDIISRDVALKGIKQANREIELRYLQSTLNEFNIGENELNMLRVLGKDFINNAYGIIVLKSLILLNIFLNLMKRFLMISFKSLLMRILSN